MIILGLVGILKKIIAVVRVSINTMMDPLAGKAENNSAKVLQKQKITRNVRTNGVQKMAMHEIIGVGGTGIKMR